MLIHDGVGVRCYMLGVDVGVTVLVGVGGVDGAGVGAGAGVCVSGVIVTLSRRVTILWHFA